MEAQPIKDSIREKLGAIKPQLISQVGNFRVEIFNQDKCVKSNMIGIKVLDFVGKTEYQGQNIKLQHIKLQTLKVALDNYNKPDKQITLSFKIEENILKAIIKIQLPYLLPITQTLSLKKIRELKDDDIFHERLTILSQKIKNMKNNNKSKSTIFFSAQLNEKSFQNINANMEPILSLQLPKGKYIITFSFLLNTLTQWIYLYFNKKPLQFRNQSGFYQADSTHFYPHIIRIVHQVESQKQTVSMNHHYTSTYKIVLRNCILTAAPTQMDKINVNYQQNIYPDYYDQGMDEMFG